MKHETKKGSPRLKGALADARASRRKSLRVSGAVTKPPTAPKFLIDTTAKKYYRAVCNFLIENSALASIDAYAVAIYANALRRLDIYEADLQATDPIQTFESGARQLDPAYTLVEKQIATVWKLGKELGLTNWGREKMDAFKVSEAEEGDELMDLLTKGPRKYSQN